MLSFLRHLLGIGLILLGAILAGVYLSIQFASHPWPGTSPNPAVRFFQSALFILGAKPPEQIVLLCASGALLVLGAVLARMVAALLYAGALGCLAVLGAAWVAAAAPQPGSDGWIPRLAQTLVPLLDRDGKDLGIVAGLGGSLLFLAVFANLWARWNAKRSKPARARAERQRPGTPGRPAPAQKEVPAPDDSEILLDEPDHEGADSETEGDV